MNRGEVAVGDGPSVGGLVRRFSRSFCALFSDERGPGVGDGVVGGVGYSKTSPSTCNEIPSSTLFEMRGIAGRTRDDYKYRRTGGQ